MLAIFEKYSGDIREARTDQQIIEILARVCGDFGFRSGYVIEYSEDLKSALHVLDTNAERRAWWEEYFASGMRMATHALRELLQEGKAQVFSADRFAGPRDPLLIFATKADLLESLFVPVTYDSKIVGAAGFSGNPVLSQARTSALQLLVYAQIAQPR